MTPQDISLEKKWESCRFYPYLDAVGIPTQGFGATRGLTGERVKLTDSPWDMATALFVLKRDALIAWRGAEPLLRAGLKQHEVDAITSWVFNLGEGKLKVSTLRTCINRRDADGVAREWVRWNRAGGKVLRGLTLRREEELRYWRFP